MATAVSTTPTTLDSGTGYELFVLNSGAANVIVTVGALQQKRLRPGQSARYFTGGQAVTAVTESGSSQVDVTVSGTPEPNPSGAFVSHTDALTTLFGPTYNAAGYGADPTGVADSAAGVQAAVNAAVAQIVATSRGAVVYIPQGVYTWSSAPVALPPNLTAPLTIRVEGGARINLTATAARLFDYVPVANGDTFQNIFIDGGGGRFGVGGAIIDAGAVSTVGVGEDQHVIAGLRRPTSFPFVNYSKMQVRGFRGVNCPIGSGSLRNWVTWGLYATQSGTRYTASFISAADMDLAGGVGGVSVSAGNADGGTSYANAFMDEVSVVRVAHDLGASPTAQYTSLNFLFGSKGSGGRLLVEDCRGYNSADVGLEMDSWADVTIRGCDFANAYTSNYYITAFAPVAATDRILFDNCTASRTTLTFAEGGSSSLYGRGWFIDQQPTYLATPNVVLNNCRWKRTTVEGCQEGEALYVGMRSGTVNVLFQNFDARAESLTLPETGSRVFSMVGVRNYTGSGTVTIKGSLKTRYAGTKTGAGTPSLRHISVIADGGTPTTIIDLNDSSYMMNIPTANGGPFVDVRIGTTTIRLRRIVPEAGSWTGNARVVYAVPGVTVTSAVMADCDFTALGTYGTAWTHFRRDDTTQDAKLRLRDCIGVPDTVTKTANYTVDPVADKVVLASGAGVTITLPDGSKVYTGRQFTVRNTDASNAVTVGAVAGTIDGGATASLAAAAKATYASNGTNWFAVA